MRTRFQLIIPCKVSRSFVDRLSRVADGILGRKFFLDAIKWRNFLWNFFRLLEVQIKMFDRNWSESNGMLSEKSAVEIAAESTWTSKKVELKNLMMKTDRISVNLKRNESWERSMGKEWWKLQRTLAFDDLFSMNHC